MFELDKIEAMKWFKLSADQGFDWAQYNLGDLSENKEEKLKYLIMAHDQGLEDATALIKELNLLIRCSP